MPNINLATEDFSKSNSFSFGKGLTFSIIVLILVGALYGALFVYNRKLISEIESTSAEYNMEYDKLVAGNGSEIIDFKNRSNLATEMLTENKSMKDILSWLESSMLPSVYITSLKYDEAKKTIDLSCVGDNFQAMAKQVSSFKQSDYFSAVIPGASSVDSTKNNKLVFDINLTIK